MSPAPRKTTTKTVAGEGEGVTGFISLPPIEQRTALFPIRGTTPVIPHKWSAKALEMMRAAQQTPRRGSIRAPREPKNPDEEAEASCYYLPDGVTPGMPATAFKAAIVGAVRLFPGLTMVAAKQILFVRGEGPDQLIGIAGERSLREDTPRNANGGADLRYRYQYFPWVTTIPITFVASSIDLASVAQLVQAAGMGGVGDWRPSSPKSASGTYGQWEIDGDIIVQG